MTSLKLAPFIFNDSRTVKVATNYRLSAKDEADIDFDNSCECLNFRKGHLQFWISIISILIWYISFYEYFLLKNKINV